MRGVDLDDVEPGFLGAASALAEGFDDFLDAFSRQRLGNARLGRERNSRGRDSAAVNAELTTSMAQLASCLGVETVNDLDHAGQTRHLILIPDTNISRTDEAIVHYGGRLEEYQACSAQRSCPVMDEMEVADASVFAGRVHAHRRHGDPVLELGASDRDGGEKFSGHSTDLPCDTVSDAKEVKPSPNETIRQKIASTSLRDSVLSRFEELPHAP